jgi:peptidoglycan/xylan/chitin deacetylase (PgdA/CDA1 family)
VETKALLDKVMTDGLSRRHLLRLMAGAGAAVAAGGLTRAARAATTFRTTAALNLRTGPGTGYAVILVMPAGATVVDYDGELVNGFRSVDYSGTVGWCSNAYLAPVASPPPSPPPVIVDPSAVALSGVSGKVNVAGGLNLRTGPAATYQLIRVLPNGAVLAISAASGDWFKVTSGGSTGWVNSWYVTLTGTPSQEIRRGNTNRKMVALTFDCGSDLGYTEQIITTLERYGVPASFGLTGTWVNAYPDHAAWIVADGHQALNHTYAHLSCTGASTGTGPLSPAKRLGQLVANESAIRSLAGGTAKPYWRPPYGDCDGGVLRDAGAAGYGKTVMWTVDSMGWNGATADQIYNRVMSNAGNGAIVLMHVGGASRDAAALERIIRGLRDRGYAFGTVAQVIAP